MQNLLSAFTFLFAAHLAFAAEPAVKFNRDVRPILSDKCYHCHGPDAAERKAKLRFDIREEALRDRDGIRAIVPGDVDASDAIERIFSSDKKEQMPPPKAHLDLTESEKNTLRKWVAQGAEYAPHWAFVPLPDSIPAPSVKNEVWAKNEIDRFILARLEAENLAPSPEATRERWLRRATFDLTGLPPTQPEIDAFLADQNDGAYERVADRLLASPRFGERMAVPWLDVARYADSFGYQADIDTHAWPYRDWVIRALNDNLPWDEFITWQLAGDLLPGATREQKLATAFNRIHRKTNEGGSVAEEFRQDGVNDRVQTVGTAFLGLTLECARCHDHKFDPIKQRDFYALGAFFNSIDEHGLLHALANIQPQPALLLPTPEQEQKLAHQKAAIAAAEAELEKTNAAREPAFQQWLAAHPAQPATLPDRAASFDFDSEKSGVLANAAHPDQPATLGANTLVPGHAGSAIRFTGDDELKLPAVPLAHMHAPATFAFWLQPGADYPRAVVLHNSNSPDINYNGFDLRLEHGHLQWMVVREWPGNAIAIRTKATVPVGAWTHVAATYDGSARAAGLQLWINGAPAETEVLRDKLTRDTVATNDLRLGARTRDLGLRAGAIDDLQIFTRALTPLEIAQLHDGQIPALENSGPVRDFYFSAIDPETRAAVAKIAAARDTWRGILAGVSELPVMAEEPQPRPTFILARGAYDAPAAPVERTTPDALPPFPPNAPCNRLGLAQWLTDPHHPLTARVLANRLWQEFFGRGIVVTAENFGLQGAQPSHPELLDWLARDFIAHGWDHKRACRQIVLSATYRQTSTASRDLRERDPDNILLARGPARRLPAEMLRDDALALGGILEPGLGGPPVRPYAPDGSMGKSLNNFLPEYRADTGAALHRRSLYTFWRRTTPPPNMMVFDTATRDVCTARRQPTNTPLQPLVLLNDPQFVEAARALGERMLRDGGGTPEQRVAWLFREVTSRPPTARELPDLVALYESQRATFTDDPTRATAFLKIGEHPADPAFPPIELAAAVTTATAIFNLDASVMLR